MNDINEIVPLDKLIGKYNQITKLADHIHQNNPMLVTKKHIRDRSVLYYLEILKKFENHHDNQ